MRILSFLRRPIVGSDTTGALVYRKPFGYAPSDYRGNGGRSTARHLNATAPMGITPGPSHRLVDPTVTGVVPGAFEVEPLSTIPTGNAPAQV